MKFTRESSSDVLVGDEYFHGLIECNLTFTTTKPLVKYPVQCTFGSVYIVDLLMYNITKYKYSALLLKGEETSRIVRAIDYELVCE